MDEQQIQEQTEEISNQVTEEVSTEAIEEVKEPEKKDKKDFWRKFAHFLLNPVLPILLSGLMRAFAVYIFITPNKFAPGGTNGIAVLLEYATGWNSGIFLLLISIPLFFLAFFCLGKKEAIESTLSFVVSSGILMVLPSIPNMPSYGGGEGIDRIVHGLFGAVAGGIFLGIALAIMLKSCGASGGTSIIASVINKKFRNLSISMLTAAFDAVVVIASIFVYGRGKSFTDALNPVFLALVSLFVTSKVSDVILQGFKTAFKFEIVTTHPDEVAAEIMTKLHRGVTRIEAEGMYTKQEKSMLVCLIRKRQIGEFQKIIRSYPDTFAYFTSTSEVFGKFNK
ncbi:MAG: YitT family protein [Clostridia bacterium]|nr:YitT family protein [Clostridia bacterium]